MSRSRFLVPALALALLALTIAIRPAAAAWPHELYNGNVPLCTIAGTQDSLTGVSDGAGGAIVAWRDFRTGISDIYVQRVSATGAPQWTADGVALCTATDSQINPTIASDGAGGAIVTWQDPRSGSKDIYARRITAAGVPQWAANGVALCTSSGDQQYPTIVADGAGGAIVSWHDDRSGTSEDIYAQRIDAAGTPQWTANGVALCTAAGNQTLPTIVPDSGGAIVAWQDFRSGNNDIYAMRINAAGSPRWPANGVALCTDTGLQLGPIIVSDSAGGAIVTWRDYRPPSPDHIYAQRISGGGVPLWYPDGIPVCTGTSNNNYSPRAVSDGAGGAIVTWFDIRSGGFLDIYAQRITAAGLPKWPANGVALCTAPLNQETLAIASDDAGGAIVTWSDPFNNTGHDIYAQRINAVGAPQWTANGVALCTAVNLQNRPAIVPDGAGGAIVIWQDYRSSNFDIYAQRIEKFGKLGSPEPTIATVLDIPNDQGGRVRLAWDASYLDLEYDPDLTAYDIFHSVPPNVAQDAIVRGSSRHLNLGEVPTAGDRAHLFTVSGTQELAWEYVSTVNLQHFISTYGSTQATTGDSIAGSNPTTSFMVVGRNGTGSKYWLSTAAAGYSVDNLAPATPSPFTGQYAAGTATLHWNRNPEGDLAGYRLYRGTSTVFVPGPANLVGTLPDTGYADAAGAPYAYKLTAVDSHGNESRAATLVPSGALDAGDGLTPMALGFASPSPNPAQGSTALRYTLSRAGHVRLTVYDCTGRRVQLLRDGELPAGAHREHFALRDEAGRKLASGLYLVRLEAEGRVLTRRLAAIR